MVIQRKTVFASNTKNRSAFVNARKRKKKNSRRNYWWGCSLHNPISDLLLKPLFQNEAKREADFLFSWKWNSSSQQRFCPQLIYSLNLKVRVFGTRIWPIELVLRLCHLKSMSLQNKRYLSNKQFSYKCCAFKLLHFTRRKVASIKPRCTKKPRN